MKKFIVFILMVLISMSLIGCNDVTQNVEMRKYTASFLSLFDTVTYIVGYSKTQEDFEIKAQEIHDKLEIYHKLFDIYNTYEGINNIKVINDNAGKNEVNVDPIIIEFLVECKEYYNITKGKVNVAMGSVLSLWHDARTEGINNPFEAELPSEEKLKEAQKHISFNSIIINEEQSTVYISDPLCKLDVGAIAKGWSVQRVAEEYTEGFLISVGGNVCATGPKPNETPWVVGIQKHNSSTEYLHTLNIMKCLKEYDAGATFFTALFLFPLEEGKSILQQFKAEAVWVDMEDYVYYSNGFQEYIKI